MDKKFKLGLMIGIPTGVLVIGLASVIGVIISKQNSNSIVNNKNGQGLLGDGLYDEMTVWKNQAVDVDSLYEQYGKRIEYHGEHNSGNWKYGEIWDPAEKQRLKDNDLLWYDGDDPAAAQRAISLPALDGSKRGKVNLSTDDENFLRRIGNPYGWGLPVRYSEDLLNKNVWTGIYFIWKNNQWYVVGSFLNAGAYSPRRAPTGNNQFDSEMLFYTGNSGGDPSDLARRYNIKNKDKNFDRWYSFKFNAKQWESSQGYRIERPLRAVLHATKGVRI